MNTDENRDPITKEPGSHPVGTGVGAASAGLAGAAAGTVIGGPVGGVIGAIVGSVAGGSAGHNVAESNNPTDPVAEESYWREKHKDQPYSKEGQDYDSYAPAYRTGYEGHGRYATGGRTFEEAESDLEKDYVAGRGESTVDWPEAKPAVRAAFLRVDEHRKSDV